VCPYAAHVFPFVGLIRFDSSLCEFEGTKMAQILIIDDDPAIRVTIEEILQSAGHAVISAVDGREGVKLFRANPAEVVITDLYMPNQDGLETIRELRRGNAKAVIIAMCGKPMGETMLSIAQKLGAVGVLQKPFVPEELLDTVEQALSG
jgi:CheY-like chemotaxis protein